MKNTMKAFLSDLVKISKADKSFRNLHDILDSEKYWSNSADRSFHTIKDAKEFFRTELA